MIVRLLKWIQAEWRAYVRDREQARLDREIGRAALFLGLVDIGLPQENPVNEKGEPLVRMHFACPVPARVGVLVSPPEQQVYWCYRCKVTWHYEGDDDEDGGGKKSRRTSPLRPTGWQPNPEWKESEKVIRDLMRKKTLHLH